jgi:hypothetical protein
MTTQIIMSCNASKLFCEWMTAQKVVPSSGYNPILLPIQIELDKQFTEIKLRKRLKERPSVVEIDKVKVIKSDIEIAAMICPSVRPKIRFFEECASPVA